MSENLITSINKAFIGIVRRAEQRSSQQLLETFVDTGLLMTVLSSVDHQVMFGRRGTGKTHAFGYFAQEKRDAGDIVASIDLRSIGSSGGIYSSHEYPQPERATRLLCDVLSALHDTLLEACLEATNDALNLAVLGPILDSLADAITEVVVHGDLTVEHGQENATSHEQKNTISTKLFPKPEWSLVGSSDDKASNKSTSRTVVSGKPSARVHFGSVGSALRSLGQNTDGARVWVLLDEWSSLPTELQPLLGDLIRRAVLTAQNFTVKIAAIEKRSDFIRWTGDGGYVGLEVGADVTADVNLDDYMVFDNDETKSTSFFEDLVYRHLVSINPSLVSDIPSSGTMVATAFTQRPCFGELVRAAEGVPRDAINILSQAAQQAFSERISIPHIRASASRWYTRDKENPIRSNQAAQILLHWVIDKVIGERRARAFLLRTGETDDLIEELYDSRVLHILKRNISSQDEPGVRYDVYKLDYGCYIDLVSTTRAPQGLLPLGDGETTNPKFVEVPPDDYRSIRRAILNLKTFYDANETNASER